MMICSLLGIYVLAPEALVLAIWARDWQGRDRPQVLVLYHKMGLCSDGLMPKPTGTIAGPAVTCADCTGTLRCTDATCYT